MSDITDQINELLTPVYSKKENAVTAVTETTGSTWEQVGMRKLSNAEYKKYLDDNGYHTDNVGHAPPHGSFITESGGTFTPLYEYLSAANSHLILQRRNRSVENSIRDRFEEYVKDGTTEFTIDLEFINMLLKDLGCDPIKVQRTYRWSATVSFEVTGTVEASSSDEAWEKVQEYIDGFESCDTPYHTPDEIEDVDTNIQNAEVDEVDED